MKKKKKIELIEVKQDNLKLIEAALKRIKSNYQALPHPLLVNPYRVIYNFNEKDPVSFGYRVAGGINFLAEFRRGFVYTIEAEILDDSFVLYEPVMGNGNLVPFGTENIHGTKRVEQRLKEKALEVAERCVLEELVDGKTFFISRGREAEKWMKESEKFSRCYIFDAGNLDEKARKELSKHHFFKLFFSEKYME